MKPKEVHTSLLGVERCPTQDSMAIIDTKDK